jgi:tRNA threonylcarbamoyladenosine modification (KEOPS) complex  Pcc1 subunit
MIHKIKCKLTFCYESIDPAVILGATEIDNYDYVTAQSENNQLVCEINSESVTSLLNTINDLLSAIKLAETIYLLS